MPGLPLAAREYGAPARTCLLLSSQSWYFPANTEKPFKKSSVREIGCQEMEDTTNIAKVRATSQSVLVAPSWNGEPKATELLETVVRDKEKYEAFLTNQRSG
jgi:hypothetical protein